MAKPKFVAEDPAPRKSTGIQRSKYADWIETAIANPNQWFKWNIPMSAGFQNQIKRIMNNRYPEYKFGYSSRKGDQTGTKRYQYILAYPLDEII